MTQINYLDKTWSPVSGCSGKGCKARCWVPPLLKRFPAIHGFLKPLFQESSVEPLAFEQVQFHPDRLDQPLHWRKPRRIGVCFTGDLFDEQVPFEWIDQVFEKMGWAIQHKYFLLTKQVGRMLQYSQRLQRVATHPREPFPNVYWGVSITDQEDADTKIPDLLRIPGRHWVSVEPMLGPVSLAGFDGKTYRPWLDRCAWPTLIDFIVIGCESGPKRRPCPIENMVSVVEQCQAAGVPVYVKQVSINGKVVHDINLFPEALKVRELPCQT